ncbi:uncharacterized CRM domain-containing protein At3g25440, chloroplastic [Andrographis paniculata]|uniref:uncharacterized CRM domain-containing protein At3g25440, chloroplastic n=1 Tax=Andrographis paniculata TaxID=175694 RepID=UPI0021E8D819|nr:uncharacterized CRM domain-containing protein At3g25440, chloroplastic [Andrographis paniculata]XP_051138866.1 uncharacterized CRM domain-containing protein At3g25440, chloroplastic [Andrographis paniculata]XP_051138875.1 uncharacterized CRM domain-containing protein At3g25440, chloroplastic [Andrographis paniculata]
MPNPLISGLWKIISGSATTRSVSYRESPHCYKWLVRRISNPAYSVETALPVRCKGCFGFRNHGMIMYRSSLLGAQPDRRSCMFEVRSMIRGYAKATANAAIVLNTNEDVIRFDVGNEPGGRSSLKEANKTARKAEMSRKAKLNELRFYRLKAKKKMNSPNPEVRIRYKLEKAKRKETWLIEKLRKYEFPKALPETHDPEILTEEERFYLKRTGEKKKHYVPVGRRGVFGGVVLNMHLHWKRHETVKVVCKPCKPGQVNQYAEELSRLSKGIIIDIKPNNIIIFYRGKNYVQPDIMSPLDTLSKAKALEKYRYEQSLEHTSMFIEKLENELEEYYKHRERYNKAKS